MTYLEKLVLALLMLIGVTLSAQDLKVTEFRADMSMTDAVRFPKTDLNGERCGLIRLGMVLPDATFEGDIISSEYKDGEWWIYMINGANWITILSKDYTPLRYEFEEGILSNVTYVMKVLKPDEYTISNGKALFHSAVFPGWGQRGKNRPVRGALFLTGEVASLAGFGYFLIKEKQQLKIMNNSEVSWEEFAQAEANYDSYYRNRNIFIVAAATIYGLNLFDAYFSRPKKPKNLEVKPTAMINEWGVAPGASITYNF